MWRRIKVYFGLADPDEPEGAAELGWVRRGLVSGALWLLVISVVATAIALTLLEWDASGLAIGLPIGAVIFGALHYHTDTQHEVPYGPLGRLPAHWGDVPQTGVDWRAVVRRVLWLVVLVPLLWILDLAGAREFWFVMPGQFVGMAAAELWGAARVARWERSNGRRVAARTVGGQVTGLYAVSPG